MPIIQSVQRALQILELSFDEHKTELRISEISIATGLHKSTLHSLLKTLQAAGYIDQNAENGRYRLGLKLIERGSLVVNSIDMRKRANPMLVELSRETGQTAHLGVSGRLPRRLYRQGRGAGRADRLFAHRPAAAHPLHGHRQVSALQNGSQEGGGASEGLRVREAYRPQPSTAWRRSSPIWTGWRRKALPATTRNTRWAFAASARPSSTTPERSWRRCPFSTLTSVTPAAETATYTDAVRKTAATISKALGFKGA